MLLYWFIDLLREVVNFLPTWLLVILAVIIGWFIVIIVFGKDKN